MSLLLNMITNNTRHFTPPGTNKNIRMGVARWKSRASALTRLHCGISTISRLLPPCDNESVGLFRFVFSFSPEIGPRLTRGHLMKQPRVQSASFRITQEFLALLIAMRCVGIATSATVYQRQRLILNIATGSKRPAAAMRRTSRPIQKR
jgi:hypothetical protein